MVAAYIDPALGVLRAEVKAKHPGIVVGWIGDPAHAARHSDHNPEADGSVDAIDLMIGPHFSTAQAQAIVDALTYYKDWRISYIIWHERIWHNDSGWKAYGGSDPHTNHVHISRNDIRETNTDPWKIEKPKPKPPAHKELKKGDKGNEVKLVQKAVGVKADGDFGPNTEKAVKAFQKAHKLTADGVVGPKTWVAIDKENKK